MWLRAGWFSVVGPCPVQCRMLSSIHGLYLLDPSSTPRAVVMSPKHPQKLPNVPWVGWGAESYRALWFWDSALRALVIASRHHCLTRHDFNSQHIISVNAHNHPTSLVLLFSYKWGYWSQGRKVTCPRSLGDEPSRNPILELQNKYFSIVTHETWKFQTPELLWIQKSGLQAESFPSLNAWVQIPGPPLGSFVAWVKLLNLSVLIHKMGTIEIVPTHSGFGRILWTNTQEALTMVPGML